MPLENTLIEGGKPSRLYGVCTYAVGESRLAAYMDTHAGRLCTTHILTKWWSEGHTEYGLIGTYPLSELFTDRLVLEWDLKIPLLTEYRCAYHRKYGRGGRAEGISEGLSQPAADAVSSSSRKSQTGEDSSRNVRVLTYLPMEGSSSM